MPGKDNTGPKGKGPKTGQGKGDCNGTRTQDDTRQGGGQGWGGRRHRNRFHATGLTGWQRAQMGRNGQGAGFQPALSRDQELVALKQQVESIESTLGSLKSRIQEITRDATGREPR